jgi:hypothetical protein
MPTYLISAVRIRKDINNTSLTGDIHTAHVRCFDTHKKGRAEYSKKLYVVFLYGYVKLGENIPYPDRQHPRL